MGHCSIVNTSAFYLAFRGELIFFQNCFDHLLFSSLTAKNSSPVL